MKKNLLLLGIFVFIIGGCSGWPGDKEALKESCESAYRACQDRCGGNGECSRACTGGYNGCIENIEEDKASDWQPADAFYDGCTDVCSEYPCNIGCAVGQDRAAKETAAILKKYGTVTY